LPNSTEITTSPQLWITRVGEDTKLLEQETVLLLSQSEKRRLDATKNINKRREYLLSRALMRHAFSKLFNLPISEWKFIDKPNSAPIITNLQDKTFFSLSHSKGYICFVISQFPVGIDIEAINKKRDFSALADVFMSNEEINTLLNTDMEHETQAEYFYRIWCAKEAYYKASNPININLGAKRINELSILQMLEDDNWGLSEFLIDSFLLSIVSKHKSLSLITNLFHLNIQVEEMLK